MPDQTFLLANMVIMVAYAAITVAIVMAALWVIGWLAHPAGRRWYYW